MTDTTHVLDHDRWRVLSTRLADLAAARVELAPQCAAARAPVETLARLWRDARRVLAGDALAAERLAALIASAIPAAALVETARKATELARKTKLSEEHDPGILRIGELAVLGVAATCVAPPGLAAIYAATIHGLALQAAPAEILARLEPHGAPRDLLGDLVARLIPPATAADPPGRLVLERFLYERHELGRWHCLDRAFGALDLDAMSSATAPVRLAAWSPATADRIASVERTTAGVAMLGAFAWSSEDLLVALGAIATSDGDGIAAAAVEHGAITELASDRIVASFAQPIEWVGYATTAGIREAQAVRVRVREQLARIARQPCIGDPRLPSLISDVAALAELREAPPRRAGNRVPPGALRAPPPVAGRARGSATNGRRREPAAARLASDPEHTVAVVIVRPSVVGSDGTARRVDQAHGNALAADLAALVGAEPQIVTLPWVEDALAVQVAPFDAGDDPRVAVMLEELDRAAARIRNRERALWVALVPEAGGDAASDGTAPPAPLGVAHPGSAALAVAVGTPAGARRAISALLDRLAAAIAPEPGALAHETGIAVVRGAGRGIAQRLRIVGSCENRTIRLIDAPRLDDARAAGPGAPVDLGLTAVCIDAAGHELARSAVHGHRTGAASFVALPAITDDVARIELQTDGETVLRLARPATPPVLGAVDQWTEQARLSLGWRLGDGDSHETVLEAAAEGSDDWVPVTALPAGRARNLVPSWRLPPGTRFRLVVTNGWQTVASIEFAPADVLTGPYVIRRPSAEVVWAELPDTSSATPSWHLPDGTVSNSRLQRLDPHASGDVQLDVGGIVDVRPIKQLAEGRWRRS